MGRLDISYAYRRKNIFLGSFENFTTVLTVSPNLLRTQTGATPQRNRISLENLSLQNVCSHFIRIKPKERIWKAVVFTFGYSQVEFQHTHKRQTSPQAKHHKPSLHIISLHFYVYSNFFGSYQLKGKYNTHIQQLNISLHFSSLHTLTSIINWKAKTIQIY